MAKDIFIYIYIYTPGVSSFLFFSTPLFTLYHPRYRSKVPQLVRFRPPEGYFLSSILFLLFFFILNSYIYISFRIFHRVRRAAPLLLHAAATVVYRFFLLFSRSPGRVGRQPLAFHSCHVTLLNRPAESNS
ncbi:unnamed protein product [Aphis gossypii]|uniref:Uncharacterized protein n=1 Tax=Aphis gossypii TaxID=80765 RepID=A0A9P0IPU5_APHGO|nr:unnamed protein product [Aphis gossypii]